MRVTALRGREWRNLRGRVGTVFQDPASSLNGAAPVADPDVQREGAPGGGAPPTDSAPRPANRQQTHARPPAGAGYRTVLA